MSVIHNTSKPESTLKKKCNVIAYHVLQNSVAMGETLTEHIRSEDNPANLLTKMVSGQKSKYLVSSMLSDIYEGDT